MKYKIEVSGMHCSGCETLIKMSLEELGFETVNVSMKNKTVFFEGSTNTQIVKDSIDKIFADFDKYKYSNLVTV